MLKSVCIGTDWNFYEEFDEILNLYITTQHHHSHSWFDIVEMVIVRSYSDNDREAKLLCAMSSVSILQFVKTRRDQTNDIALFLSMIMTGHHSLSRSLSEMKFVEIESDANRFFIFLSSMTSLTKLELNTVSLRNNSFNAPQCPALKELSCRGGNSAKPILRWFSQAAETIEQQHPGQCHVNQESIPVNMCIPIETIQIVGVTLDQDDVCNFTKAMRHMVHIKHLTLTKIRMQPSEWGKMFDGFGNAFQHRGHLCYRKRIQGHDIGNGSVLEVPLEELDLSDNEIDDSMSEFVHAYKHMTRLKCLKLRHVRLKVHQCETLFDGFIEAGSSRDGGLALEELVFVWCNIGVSAGKLAQAYRYMKRLKCLDLTKTKLQAHHFETLCDGFSQAGSSENSGLALEKMVLSWCKIGDSAGKFSQAYGYMTQLKCLDLSHTGFDCEKLFDGFIEVGSSRNGELALEQLKLIWCKIGESVAKLAQAYRYMMRLKYLNLCNTGLQVRHCETLFDGFIKVGRSRDGGLALEKLNLSWCEIGESASKLAQAYRYMMRLKCLSLSTIFLQSHHCEKLFDGFVEVGSSRYTALALEELVLSPSCSCEIDKSVSKLFLGLQYMSHLKKFKLYSCNVKKQDIDLILRTLKNINSKCIVRFG